MKVVILCGGKGSRLGEVTQNSIPKPMVRIGEMPIVEHIMRYYSKFGYNDFILCVGHLSWEIKDYFVSLRERLADLTLNFETGDISIQSYQRLPAWNLTIAETGIDTMTAGRVRQILRYIPEGESFMLTYGDGLSNVDLGALGAFHLKHGKGLTMTGVIPPGRFGEIILNQNQISEWAEKPQQSDRYINGGFMVLTRGFADRYIGDCNDEIMLEREPFEQAASDGEMMLYRHDGFWQCMDTLRDWELLNRIWSSGQAPWAVVSENGGI